MTDEDGPGTSPSPHEARLEAALSEYYTSLDEGRKPERAVLLARYPELREDLEKIFESVGFVGRLEGRLRQVGGAGLVLPLAAGGHLGDYKIVGEIAHGGMGVVYRAWQRSLGRTVALKVVLTGEFASEQERRRFRREAELAAALDHPNIVPVYEVGEEGGLCYLAMRLIEGKSLGELDAPIADRPRFGARVVETIARAIHYAHRSGIIHRDLKPANILMDERGEPHIVDFGLARLQNHSGTITRTGTILGTLRYMAPEQASDETTDTDATVDVYGLGAILYQLLTGVPPFSASSSVVLLKQVLEDDPLHPAFHDPAVPRDLVTICLKCLHKTPRRRYQTAEDVADELKRFLESQPIHARPAGLIERSMKWVQRRPAMLAIVSLFVFVVVTVVIALNYERELRRRTHELYAAELSRAHQGVIKSEFTPAREFLDKYASSQGEEDLRGFGWYYLWRLAHMDQSTQSLPVSENSWVSFTPDNRRVAVSTSREISVWDVAKLVGARKVEPYRMPNRRSGRTDGFCFSTDGQLIAFVDGFHEEVLVKKIGTQKTVHKTKARFVAWSPALDALVTLDKDGNLRVTQIRPTIHVVRSFTTSPPLFGGFAVSSDGTVAAIVSAGGVLEIWNLVAEKRTGPFALGEVHTDCLGAWIAVSHDGKLVACGHPDYRVTLWDTVNGTQVRTLSGHSSPVRCVAFSPGGDRLASGGDDRSIRIWNVRDSTEAEVLLGHDGYVSSVSFDREGGLLASTSTVDDSLKLWDISRSRLNDAFPSERLLTTDYVIRTLVCTPEGGTVIVGEIYDTIHVLHLDTTSGLEARRLDTIQGAQLGDYYHGASSPDGGLVAAIRRPDHHVVVRGFVRQGDTVLFGDSVLAGGHTSNVESLGFSPDGSLLGTSDRDRRIKLWKRQDSSATFQPMIDIAATCEGIDFVFSPDRRFLAMSCTSGMVFLCDLDKEYEPTEFLAGDFERPIGAVLFSPDSQYLAVGGRDRVVTIWDLGGGWSPGESPTEFMRCSGHVGSIFSLAFTPDGSRLASGSADTTIKIWDMTVTPRDRKAIECLTLRGHEGVVTALAFTPDGRTLLSGGDLQSGGQRQDGQAEVRAWRGASDVEIRSDLGQ